MFSTHKGLRIETYGVPRFFSSQGFVFIFFIFSTSVGRYLVLRSNVIIIMAIITIVIGIHRGIAGPGVVLALVFMVYVTVSVLVLLSLSLAVMFNV